MKYEVAIFDVTFKPTNHMTLLCFGTMGHQEANWHKAEYVKVDKAESWRSVPGDWPVRNVTHWMPLPDDPRSEPRP